MNKSAINQNMLSRLVFAIILISVLSVQIWAQSANEAIENHINIYENNTDDDAVGNADNLDKTDGTDESGEDIGVNVSEHEDGDISEKGEKGEKEEPEPIVNLRAKGSGLMLLKVPDIYFGEVPFSASSEKIQILSVNENVIVVDDLSGTGWNLTLRYENISNTLPGRLFFQRWDDVEIDIGESSLIIYTHPPRNIYETETTAIKSLADIGKGFFLETDFSDIGSGELNAPICARLIWQLTPEVY